MDAFYWMQQQAFSQATAKTMSHNAKVRCSQNKIFATLLLISILTATFSRTQPFIMIVGLGTVVATKKH